MEDEISKLRRELQELQSEAKYVADTMEYLVRILRIWIPKEPQ